ncbi:MAG: DLW-39 family protein [Actinomycetes bacterium]
MKKLIVLAVVAAAGFLVWKKLQDDKAEQDLWTEATSEFADLR